MLVLYIVEGRQAGRFAAEMRIGLIRNVKPSPDGTRHAFVQHSEIRTRAGDPVDRDVRLRHHDSPAPDFLRMALEVGAARCLRKPFTPVALLTVIDECLVEARSRFAGIAESR